MSGYGKELILDLHDCDPSTFTRDSLTDYFKQLCDLIDMKREDLHFWDELDLPEEERQTNPKTAGTSAIQFILTSNVTIHALDLMKAVYVNVFSCKDFESDAVLEFTAKWFKGRIVNRMDINRL